MKILYVSRLFTGLSEVASDRVWEPRGVPTVYRLIEALDRGKHELEIAFTVREGDSKPFCRERYNVHVDGLGCAINLLTSGSTLPTWFGRARGYISEAGRFWSIWRLYRKFRPDLLYFDRANIYQAALFARVTSTPIVWRVMGVTSGMRIILSSNNLFSQVTRWAYRSPFSQVICSLDGSGGGAWMARALLPCVPRVMKLNGAEVTVRGDLSSEILERLPDRNSTWVLFVARLVEQKGCMTFIEGFLDAILSEPAGLHAIVVGDGPYMQPMRTAVANRNATGSVTFLGEVPHHQVTALQLAADIYVSLNQLGNLSNANLEAMKAGTCIVFPSSQPQVGIDLDTDKVIPPDAVFRIDNCHDQKGLTDALLMLHRNSDLREQLAKKMRCVANALIPTWTERINEEVELLEEIVERSHGQNGGESQGLD